MAVIYTPHFVQFFYDTGAPLSGGKLYTYAAGTSTPKATYTDASGSTPNANPVVLDAAGRATVFLTGSYKFTLKTSGDVLVKETDNVTAFTSSGSSVDSITTSFTEDVITASDSVIFSDASDGGNTKRDTVQGLLDLAGTGADSYVSTQSPSGVSSVTFTTGFDISLYSEYSFILDGIVLSGANDIYIQFSTDGGSSFLTTNYYSTVWSNTGTGTTQVLGPSTAIQLNANADTNPKYCVVKIHQRSGIHPEAILDGKDVPGTTNNTRVSGAGRNTTTATVNAVKFLTSAGTMTGNIYMYRKKKS